MNKTIMMGRLTRDPEVRYTNTSNGSTAIASFSLAVDRRFKRDGEPDADFFNCTAFGKIAEVIEKHVVKGTKLLITGRIQNNNYTNKDGQKVYGVQILVDEMEFAESKNASNGGQAQAQPEPAPSGDGFMQVPDNLDDELPF